MKKVLFFTVFAILGLASCSKSEIEYDNQPQEISLFAVNKVATKAPVEGTTFPYVYKMMVAAYLADGDGVTTGGRDYFTATPFSKNGDYDYWTGGKYWPISAATLNFLAVAPEVEDVVETTTLDSPFAAKSVTTVSGNEFLATQYDVMYATARASKTAGNAPSNVSMVFKHAYSLIDFNFKKTVSDVDIKINSITLTEVACNGTLTVSVPNATASTGELTTNQVWTATKASLTVPGSELTIPAPATPEVFTRFNSGIMLIPEHPMTSFVIDYTITVGSDTPQNFTYTWTPTSSLSWDAGKKYIYNITMTPALIQVDPSVENWSTQPSSDVTLN